MPNDWLCVCMSRCCLSPPFLHCKFSHLTLPSCDFCIHITVLQTYICMYVRLWGCVRQCSVWVGMWDLNAVLIAVVCFVGMCYIHFNQGFIPTHSVINCSSRSRHIWIIWRNESVRQMAYTHTVHARTQTYTLILISSYTVATYQVIFDHKTINITYILDSYICNLVLCRIV